MIKELEIMKALRYLFVAIVAMLTAQSVSAQEYTRINSVAGCTTFGQTERQYQFHSTSAILMDDTQLGLAEDGAFATGISTGKPLSFAGSRRAKMEDPDPWGGGSIGDVDKPLEPGTPIGDGLWALLLMAAGYLIYRVRTRKREVTV